jgi:hypothetical protein
LSRCHGCLMIDLPKSRSGSLVCLSVRTTRSELIAAVENTVATP